MSARFAQEFREVADRYIGKSQSAIVMCRMMSQNAFLMEHRQREVVDGDRVISSFFKHMHKTIQLMRQTREAMLKKEEDDESDEEASGVA